ncbi:hypothetical protein HJC99_03955 [Candidatus Saccharibacteria bacterium]|nr:hypothetical protein [Candidatus Saccharibacteria bacterium]
MTKDSAIAARGLRLPRATCPICGKQHALRRDGRLRRHHASQICSFVAGEHDHDRCISQLGPSVVAGTIDMSWPDCPGSLQVYDAHNPTWVVQVMRPNSTYQLHYGYPSQTPLTPRPGVWLLAVSPMVQVGLVAQYTDQQVGDSLTWRLVCDWNRNQPDGKVIGALRCDHDPPRVGDDHIDCWECLKWASPRPYP